MGRDVALLFATRCLRMSGTLPGHRPGPVPHLAGLSGGDVGLLLTLTLLGDAAISLWLTTHADRIGRRRVLVAGAALMFVAGLAFVATPVFAVLAVAATIGVISPSGNEVGPFLAVEQASLSQLVPATRRTTVFARYQLVGSFATACGALLAGVVAQLAMDGGVSPADAYRLVIVGYAVVGVVLTFLFLRLDPGSRSRRTRSRTCRSVSASGCIGRSASCQPVGPVRARCVRGRLRHRELHRLLCSRSASTSTRRPWACSCSARTSWPGSRRSRRGPSRRASG